MTISKGSQTKPTRSANESLNTMTLKGTNFLALLEHYQQAQVRRFDLVRSRRRNIPFSYQIYLINKGVGSRSKGDNFSHRIVNMKGAFGSFLVVEDIW